MAERRAARKFGEQVAGGAGPALQGRSRLVRMVATLAGMRFYLDEDLSPLIAQLVRDQGGAITTVADEGRKGLSDEMQLEYAARHGRCIVTRNCKDFRRLTAAFLRDRRPHAGVLCLPPTMPPNDYQRVATAIRSWEAEHPDGAPAYLLDYLMDASS